VDANGAYGPEHTRVFQELDEFGLMMYEQPFPGPMLAEMAELQRQVRAPICLDESLESDADLFRAIELGSLQIANIKIQRVGGFGPALRIYETCRERGIRIWVGTMPELGIGCAQGAALASLDECTLPTDVEASSRWFTGDIIEPWLEVREGLLELPDSPGLGWRVDEAKLARYRVATAHFGAKRLRTSSK
jgi:O-succinylbenzoate synthase